MGFYLGSGVTPGSDNRCLTFDLVGSSLRSSIAVKAVAAALVGSLVWWSLPASAGEFTLAPRFERQELHGDLVPAMDDPYLWGLGLGYQVTDVWAVELTYLQGSAQLYQSESDADLALLRADVLFHLSGSKGIQPYMLIGGGKQRFDYGPESYENDMFNIGAGLEAAIDDRASFYLDLRIIQDLESEWTSGAVGLGWRFVLGG